MFQADLVSEQGDQGQKYALGNGFVLAFSDGEKRQCKLLHYDNPIKRVDLSDKVAKKLLVIEAVELGVIQSHLARPWRSPGKPSITIAKHTNISEWRD